MNRVVVTGIGIYSSLGVNLEAVTNSLFQGKSGIVFRPERKAMGYRSALTGYVERPNLKGLLDRRPYYDARTGRICLYGNCRSIEVGQYRY